uniref:Uncharacterized protein n=1 Tax=Tanacetum cinerariifolium TaxID=118510 RepID=A0A699KHG2_TANCI|nr:hypothetical protein [Tanacetum cinerariifolium]
MMVPQVMNGSSYCLQLKLMRLQYEVLYELRAIMEEHRASMEAYKKVHEETVRSGLRMAIVQQSMKMDMWEIKEKLVERREQMDIRAYEEDKRHEEWIQKIESVLF